MTRPGFCRPGLRMRLWLAAAVLATLAVTAAGIAVFGLSRTQSLAAEAMAAQRRIEGYATLSARTNEWLLGWMGPAASLGERPDGAGVRAALDQLDRLIAQDVAAAASETEATLRARQSVTPARLRGLFLQLDRSFAATPPDTPPGRAALAFHATQAPLAIALQTEQEIRRRDTALREMEALRRPLLAGAAGIVIAVPLVLVALYLMALRPLFHRLSQATAQAPVLAMGSLPHGADGHDELGLMFARLRQMAARIDRRRARLEQVVADRTAALSGANERLARIDASRRRFFADVGHELRTPLTVIMGEAELGAAHPDTDTRASFATVGTRAKRLFRRIEDILRIARSEDGRLELASERVDMDDCVTAALADLSPLLRRAGVTAQVDLPPMAVRGDAEWLRQVFAGILDNAAKHAGRGAEVRITGRADGDKAHIRIADTGAGLPAGVREVIFERFARADSAPGFGVGLALARWVVEALGGRLMLADPEEGAAGEGQPPQGLVLDLTLPLWREE